MQGCLAHAGFSARIEALEQHAADLEARARVEHDARLKSEKRIGLYAGILSGLISGVSAIIVAIIAALLRG